VASNVSVLGRTTAYKTMHNKLVVLRVDDKKIITAVDILRETDLNRFDLVNESALLINNGIIYNFETKEICKYKYPYIDSSRIGYGKKCGFLNRRGFFYTDEKLQDKDPWHDDGYFNLKLLRDAEKKHPNVLKYHEAVLKEKNDPEYKDIDYGKISGELRGKKFVNFTSASEEMIINYLVKHGLVDEKTYLNMYSQKQNAMIDVNRRALNDHGVQSGYILFPMHAKYIIENLFNHSLIVFIEDNGKIKIQIWK
jgi:hypothetical protein